MNVSRTSRGRSLLPLLTMSLSFASFPASAHADVFVSSLTDKATRSQADFLTGRTATQVVFRTRRGEEAPQEDAARAEPNSIGELPALAVILVLPPGLTPMNQPPMSRIPNQPLVPPPPLHVAGNNPPPALGGGPGSSGGGTTSQTSPEPASLLLALTGSGATALVVLARRRRRTAAAQALLIHAPG
jgi:hypothetical protein